MDSEHMSSIIAHLVKSFLICILRFYLSSKLNIEPESWFKQEYVDMLFPFRSTLASSLPDSLE